MTREDLFFDSKASGKKVHAVMWIPEENPVAVLQIVHGMAEHVDRYAEFAEYLVNKGFAVVADDHLGHGGSLNDDIPGFFCNGDSATVVVEDCYELTKIAKDKFKDAPYYIMGHSMGSFITRNYLFVHGDKVDKAIIMGTGMIPKSMVAVSKAVASLRCVFGMNKKPDKLLDGISFGTYNSRIENNRTNVDWLTKDDAIVDKYIADPLCGFTFTANGFKTLATLLWRLNNASNLAKMPKDLPIFIVSGEEDPVGEYGVGPRKVYESYKQLGIKDVSLKLYPTDRHEILNECDKDVVYADIYEWLSK